MHISEKDRRVSEKLFLSLCLCVSVVKISLLHSGEGHQVWRECGFAVVEDRV
jgi:hypothetical protein